MYVEGHIEKRGELGGGEEKKCPTRLMPSSSAESADLVLVRIISGRNSEVLERACGVSVEEAPDWSGVQRQPVNRNCCC